MLFSITYLFFIFHVTIHAYITGLQHYEKYHLRHSLSAADQSGG